MIWCYVYHIPFGFKEYAKILLSGPMNSVLKRGICPTEFIQSGKVKENSKFSGQSGKTRENQGKSENNFHSLEKPMFS